jgi:hypothetical protein
MLKSILASLALLLLVDGMAFGGYYRERTFVEALELSHHVLALDWMGFLD